MDIARGETVEKELDAMIVRRLARRTPTKSTRSSGRSV